jgi:hypothetical protein
MLAIATMAFEHHDRLSGAFVTNRAARAAAGEWYWCFRHMLLLKRRTASPLDDGAGPGQAAAEHDHQDVIAAFDSPGAVRFIERNRYSGS